MYRGRIIAVISLCLWMGLSLSANAAEPFPRGCHWRSLWTASACVWQH